jgi:hypothetical protein
VKHKLVPVQQRVIFVLEEAKRKCTQHLLHGLSLILWDQRSFDNIYMKRKKLSQLTPSVLLVVRPLLSYCKNSSDCWQDIYTKNKGMPTQHQGDHTKQLDSNISPEYTNSGIWYSKEKELTSKGWIYTVHRYHMLQRVLSNGNQGSRVLYLDTSANDFH